MNGGQFFWKIRVAGRRAGPRRSGGPDPGSRPLALQRATNGLAVAALEVLHERDQRVDAAFRERVVDRRADAADRAMPLEAVEAGRGRFLRERLLQLLARQAEGHVHPGPAVLRRVSAVEPAAVDL